ncbi:MAG TPA: hypothetical protein VL017_02255 [Devosia sp.]|nr:hypothetical protein [Devosia sp.]
MHLIAAIIALFRKPAAIVEDEFVPAPVEQGWRDRWADPYAIAIRHAAINRYRGAQRQADYAGLRDLQTTWLQLLGKPALLKVASATDEQIYGHLRGTATLRGVLAADRESVAAEKARRKKASFARIGTDTDGRRSGGGPSKASSSETEMIAHFEELMNPSSGPRR